MGGRYDFSGGNVNGGIVEQARQGSLKVRPYMVGMDRMEVMCPHGRRRKEMVVHLLQGEMGIVLHEETTKPRKKDEPNQRVNDTWTMRQGRHHVYFSRNILARYV